MYSIGEFSKINRITPKTLRHYDRIGLLKPATTDEWTGYRYYAGAQLPAIRRILALRSLGFSLEDIRRIVSGEVRTESELERREAELQREIRANRSRLEQVQAYLARIHEGDAMTGEVTVKALPEVIVASMRTTVPGYDAFFEIVPKMGEYMRRVGAVCREPAYCFTVFHNDEYREEDIDVEICEAVVEPCEASDQVTFKTVAGVPRAACLVHRGPYSTLGESYNALFTWIEQNGYRAVGHPRESYIDGVWNRDDPQEWRTEVQVPVAAGGGDE
ncbi:MAG: MerR family transcriptional regulator [Spirochaetota bacterium]